jgi:hypothetical protein
MPDDELIIYNRYFGDIMKAIRNREPPVVFRELYSVTLGQLHALPIRSSTRIGFRDNDPRDSV